MRFTAAAAACLAALAVAPCFGATSISRVAVSSVGPSTRIVLDAPQPFRFSLFSLHNPERVLLDLEGVSPDARIDGIAAAIRAQQGSLAIRSIRSHRSGLHSVRIELSFDDEVEPAASARWVDGTYRFFLLLQPEGVAARRANPPPLPPRAIEEPREALVEVSVNRQPARAAVLMQRRDGKLLIAEADLAAWRLLPPNGAPELHDGARYFPLDALRGLSYRFDAAAQSLSIDASAGSFSTTHLMGQVAGFTTPSSPPPGAFANYDLYVAGNRGDMTSSGMLELGAFGRLGAGTTNLVARHDADGTRVTRLESTWAYDRPQSLETLRVGDSVTRAGAWGRSVRFGGVQWSTNFATQPAFVPFPLPGLSGQTAVPSTVDLFVNDALRLRRDIPAGPFSISNLPVVTGSGEARIVVRDVLGREQVISQPYYVSPSLLKQGLHDYSYEAGFVREDFGVSSDDYGAFAASATHRFGVTDRTTLEGHAEGVRRGVAAGASVSMLWPGLGVVSASTAMSEASRGRGALVALGFAHDGRRFSSGGSVQYATPRFLQLGREPAIAPRLLVSAFAGLSLPGGGSLSLAYAGQDFRDRPAVRLLTASYGTTIRGLGFLSLSAVQNLDGPRGASAALTITRPLDPRTAASAGLRHEPGATRASAEIRRSLPAGTGWGYHVLAESGRLGREEAGLAVQNAVGTYAADATRASGSTAYRASASGGFAFLGGNAYASRRMSDSFAVVQVPGFAGVRVYADNQLVGRTSSDGSLLVPRLVPYVSTALRIEPADLPLDVMLDSIQLEAVPYYRSGLGLRFPVKRSNGATFDVILDDGKPVPAGAVARLGGSATEFPVALDGEVYMTGLAIGSNQVSVGWRGHSCAFRVAFTPGDDPLPHLGRFECHGVAR